MANKERIKKKHSAVTILQVIKLSYIGNFKREGATSRGQDNVFDALPPPVRRIYTQCTLLSRVGKGHESLKTIQSSFFRDLALNLDYLC